MGVQPANPTSSLIVVSQQFKNYSAEIRTTGLGSSGNICLLRVPPFIFELCNQFVVENSTKIIMNTNIIVLLPKSWFSPTVKQLSGSINKFLTLP